MKNHEVNLLGFVVRDSVSGLEGIADVRVTLINGNVRYSIQPLSSDGKKLEDSWEIDEHRLEVVHGGLSADVIKIPPNISIDLGFSVKDLVTGLIGIVTEKHESLNGCVNFLVVSKAEKGETSFHAKLGYERLVKVNKGISEKIKQAAEKAFEQPVRKTTKSSTSSRQSPGSQMTRVIR